MSDTSTHTLAGLLATLSPDAHTRGKQFERLTKWWLTNTPVNPFAEHGIEEVWLWEDWPDRPGPDTGIDLVARLSDGSLCAIQAKCVDENSDIPKSQLDSFISAASTRIYAHRLLIATTDGLSSNARRMLQEQHVIRIMRTELETSLSIWPNSIEELTTPILQPKWEPRPHQQEAITNVVAGLQEHDRGQLIMACGTGKTLTALWITEQLNPETTLVLVPSLSLLSQTLTEWAQHTNTTWSYICVCSDDTVNKNNDEPISTVDDFPFEVTTDPTRITRFLGTEGQKVIFSTYQSSGQVATALQHAKNGIDFAICDEAHRLTGKTDANYASILSDDKIPAAKRLFMTATPRTYTAAVKKKAEERGVDVSSMDDETVYGKVLHKLSFGEAINRGLLSDYKVVIVGVTDPQVQELIDRRELVTVNNNVETDARTLAAHIGLAKATKDYNLTRTISFHSRIKTAAKFAQDHLKILHWLPDTHRPDGPTWTDTISGAMNTGQRRRILHQLRTDEPGRHALLTNARCLTEGVDVPTLDGVAFIDPRSSQVDIIQAVGRAIRKSQTKTIGYIILPILIPMTADIEHALEDTAFKPIWSILNALKSHDEELSASLSSLRTKLGEFSMTAHLPNNIIFDLPINIDDYIQDFEQKLSLSVLERTTPAWDYWYGVLRRYSQIWNTSRVQRFDKDAPSGLPAWIHSQRVMYQNRQLSQDRSERLESLVKWTWNIREDQWNESFEELKSFVAKNGTSLVPAKYQTTEGFKLGMWVQQQRKAERLGQLEDERRTLLESLPDWSWSHLTDQWGKAYQRLKEYSRAHGHSRVPIGYLTHDDEFRLGLWVAVQRRSFRSNKLDRSRRRLLEELPGWTWSPAESTWEQGFEALLDHARATGTTRVKRGFVHAGINIDSWCTKQRVAFRRGELPQTYAELLEGLPDWSWTPKEDDWTICFEDLQLYLASAPDRPNPPKELRARNGILLRSWIQNQRTQFANGKISSERRKKLESLPSWVWSNQQFENNWDRAFDSLRAFVHRHGHFDVSDETDSSSGISLKEWIHTQRRAFKDGRLSADRVRKLESINGWLWINNGRDQLFNDGIEHLRAYFLTTGETDVPSSVVSPDGFRLGAWVSQKRFRYRKNVLPTAQVEALEAIPGWTWNPKRNGWTASYNLLKQFAERTGSAHVPDGYFVEGVQLGRWVSRQRQKFKKGQLEVERIRLLEELPGWLWSASKQCS